MLIAAIDPGREGVLAHLDCALDAHPGALGVPFGWSPLPVLTGAGLVEGDLARQLAALRPSLLVVERAQAFPKMGVVSAFNYGADWGKLLGVAAGLSIPVVTVRADVWHRAIVGAHKRSPGETKEQARIDAKARAYLHVRRTLPHVEIPRARKWAEPVVEALCMILYGRAQLAKRSEVA